MDLHSELAKVLGDERQVSVADSELDRHSRDLSHHPPRPPDVVVYPESTKDVAAVLAWANERRVAVTAFGAGTSLEGHVIPVGGGISLDLSRLDRLVELRPEDFLAVAQPGVTRSRLSEAAGAHGLWFPVDPGADATLGGMAATNASGTTTVRYGGMRAHVLALEVVLADGSVIRTGSQTVKTSAGYDLRALFVGSEGTLGVITELTLRLHGLPERAIAIRAAFPSLDAACRAATAIVGTGVTAIRVELLDADTLAAVNRYKGTSYAEAPSLFVELAGSGEGVAGDLAAVRELAEWEGCVELEHEEAADLRARLWEARHHVLFALLAAAPGKDHKSTDVCVPLSQLPGAVAHARSLADELDLEATIVAHAGDANFHVLFLLDPDDPGELAAAQRLNDEIVERALSCGGTSTGEHGVGLGKLEYLAREHGDLVPWYGAVKRLFDPNGILNPGKIVSP